MADPILIVDDDPVQRRLLDGALTKLGHATVLAEDGEEALRKIDEAKAFSVIILDLVMPGIDGIGVLEAMRERENHTPVIVQTAQGGIETVVRAMRAGAFDFVVKPVSPDRLAAAIAKAQKVEAVERQIKKRRSKPSAAAGFDDLVSASPQMTRVLAVAQKAAKSTIPVLVEGESGVGKEVLARAIQSASPRADAPFVAVNCGALPENLVESILFGHEKGAFTGAADKHVGKFQEANGGTLFLDEVGELPLDIQVKLLRAIQEGEIDPVGAKRPVKLDIRLVSATNRDLEADVRAGRFREDLYYRLNVLPVTVPPLRERRADVPALIDKFLARFGAEEGRSRPLRADREALDLLSAFDWPGNIRQLENAIFRAVVLADGDTVTASDFPQIAAQMDGFELPPADAATHPVNRQDTPPPEPLAEPVVAQLDEHQTPPMATAPQAGWLSLLSSEGQVRTLEEIEADAIRFAIDACNGRMSEVARRLGIGRSTLYRKLKDYGLAGE